MVDVDASNEHLVDAAAFVGPRPGPPTVNGSPGCTPSADLSQPAEIDVADADGTNIKRFPTAELPQFGLQYDSLFTVRRLDGRWPARRGDPHATTTPSSIA